MRRNVLAALGLFALGACGAFAQLTIDACREKARASYPLSRQYGLIDRAAAYTLSALNTAYLPQLSLSGKATTQSDINPMSGAPKDQYQLALELSQIVWDGGAVSVQKKTKAAGAAADKAGLDVDLYALDRRIDQIFFSLLILDAQLAQNAILQDELETNAERVAAYIANGVANRMDADSIEVERVDARQKRLELSSQRASYAAMLSALIGEPIPDRTEFVMPSEAIPSADLSAQGRPELALFAARGELLRLQKSAAFAADSPRVSAFFQGLYGDPSLNTLKGGADADYIVGLRFSWSLGSAYALPGTLGAIEANVRELENERETFLLNARLDIERKAAEVRKIRQLIDGDAQIIALRKRIKLSTEARVKNGTLSVPDLIREINAENLAVQVKQFREIQLQMAIRELKTLADE